VRFPGFAVRFVGERWEFSKWSGCERGEKKTKIDLGVSLTRWEWLVVEKPGRDV
jgi:hypothetical protein